MAACPVCGATELEPIAEVLDVPVFCNVLWATERQASQAPRGDIVLGLCARCGMLANVAFAPALVRYAPGYENSLHFSGVFRGFAEDLARRLAERYDLHGKQVVDIGCGSGDFLELLCAQEGVRGVGYDPSCPRESRDGNPSFVRGLYAGGPADLIVCRHVLEHLDRPAELLRALHPDAVVYFEMPDGGYMLREGAVWDLIYEHPSYFTPHAARALFEGAGYTVLELGSAFGGQYLYVEAVRQERPAPLAHAPDAVFADAARFRATFRERVAGWGERLAALAGDGRRVGLWGAGSKGITFLNTVEGGGEVCTVVDLSPRKHGRFVPGTGQRVEPPGALGPAGVDALVVTNPLYVDEIRAIQRRLGLDVELLLA